MIDTSSAKKLVESATPNSSPEYYAFLVVVGFIFCWGLFWHYKSKRGAQESANEGNKPISQNGTGLQSEDRERLVRVEESLKNFKDEIKAELKELREAFRDSIHERGELMGQIGEIKGEVKSILKEIGH